MRRLLTWARRCYLAWLERCVVEEREGYIAAGVPLGPKYLANSIATEEDLRVRIALLQ